jgi:hypothetical protein
MTGLGQNLRLPHRTIAVRFTPVSGIDSRSQALPGRARTALMHCNKTVGVALPPSRKVDVAFYPSRQCNLPESRQLQSAVLVLSAGAPALSFTD